MPKVITITKYECGVCSTQHNDEPGAKKCEQFHIDQHCRLLWEKTFPTRTKDDTRWEKYCVGCGILILKYHYIIGPGDERSVGDIQFNKSHPSHLLGGSRCADCHTKFRDELVLAVNYWRDMKGDRSRG